MREEFAKVERLVRCQKALENAATSISSSLGKQSYSPNHATSAPYEDFIIKAADMQEDIDRAVAECVQAIEDKNTEIMGKASGQRQRILRMRYLAEMSDEQIAKRLKINEKTIQNRLSGVCREQVCDCEFVRFFRETKLMFVDAEIEEAISEAYINLQDMVGVRYTAVMELVSKHTTAARELRRQYWERIKRVQEALSELSERDRGIVERRLYKQPWAMVSAATGYSVSYAKKIFAESCKSIRFFGLT